LTHIERSGLKGTNAVMQERPQVADYNLVIILWTSPQSRIDTPPVATHLLRNPDAYLTSIGSFLRKFSLDESPQLWSILKGHMSFVGQRPALFNQDDLIELRANKGIHKLVPGITGWAQVNGRDDIPIPLKVKYDEYYMKNKSFFLDLKILWLTFYIDAYGITTFCPPLFCCSGPVRMLKL